jgi:hypothetical protein
MRVVELSNHPGEMLQEIYLQRQTASERAQSSYEEAVARHRQRVQDLRDQRGQARAQRRWWAWLRYSFAVWRERSRAPRRPVAAMGSTDQEDILRAGMTGEQMVMAELGRALNDDWTLLRGYRNNRGEIDHILLGPRGVFAIEVKHRNATVRVNGDDWQFDKYDRYGNLVDRGRIADRGGRSPSRQLNEPVAELERFLRSRRQPVTIGRIVMLTHPRSRVGSATNLTVDVVATSADYVISYLSHAQGACDSQQLAQLEQLIVRDHRHHETRRPGR